MTDINGTALITCQIAADGGAIRLVFEAADGQSASLTLPIRCIQQLLMTLPHAASKAIRAMHRDETLRLVFPLGDWKLEQAAGASELILTGFSPWNFPINQAVRKISGALAAGCSIIIKAPEETPASPAELVRCFADAGVPAGVINLVYGVPAEISEYLIPHQVIRKITFTGSTAVGKQLAAMAGQHIGTRWPQPGNRV